MKKWLAALLGITMMFSMAGCSEEKKTADDENDRNNIDTESTTANVDATTIENEIEEVNEGHIVNLAPELDETTKDYCGENAEWILNDGTLTIIGHGDMWDYYEEDNIPWDSEKEDIVTVEIGKGITSVGSNAFRNCENLQTIKLSNTIKYIGISSFYGCTSLNNVELNEGIVTIDQHAFYNCAMEKIDFPDSVETIGSSAFCDCNYLVEIILPNSLVTIGDLAFQDCNKLSKVYVPKSLKTVGWHAFNIDDGEIYSVEYEGTESEWMNIGFEGRNEDLINATNIVFAK